MKVINQSTRELHDELQSLEEQMQRMVNRMARKAQFARDIRVELGVRIRVQRQAARPGGVLPSGGGIHRSDDLWLNS